MRCCDEAGAEPEASCGKKSTADEERQQGSNVACIKDGSRRRGGGVCLCWLGCQRGAVYGVRCSESRAHGRKEEVWWLRLNERGFNEAWG